MESKHIVEKRWKIKQKYWWDRECSREKRKVNRRYKKYRQGKIEKEEYLKKKKDFRILCENKEKCKKKEEQAEIRKARTEKEIWVYINKERRKKKSNENRIKTETWRNHLKSLLKGADKRIVGEGREQIVAEEDISDLSD